MNANILKYKTQIERLAKENEIPFIVVATISLNESGCNPDAKPYLEKTWRHFTTRDGKPLGLRGTVEQVQKQALEKLGREEFDFQIHAWGAFQTVGSVLRELGFKDKEFTKEFYAQGCFAMKHLNNLKKRFIARYRKQPTNEQLYAMYNGGFGAVTEDGYAQYVSNYLANAKTNEKQIT